MWQDSLKEMEMCVGSMKTERIVYTVRQRMNYIMKLCEELEDER